jgi:hypothetical protein
MTGLSTIRALKHRFIRHADSAKYTMNPRITRDLANGSLRFRKPFAWNIECKLIHAGKIKYRQIQVILKSSLYWKMWFSVF